MDQQLPSGLWRDQHWVVVARGTRMPDRCRICNEPLSKPLRPRVLKFKSSELPAMHGQAGLIIGAIEDGMAHQIVVRFGCCPQHTPRVSVKAIAWSLLAVGIAMTVVTVGFARSREESMVGLVTSVVSLVAGAICLGVPPPVTVERYVDGFAWLSGFGEAYVDTLPSLAEAHEASVDADASALEQMSAEGQQSGTEGDETGE